jgi:hypothetical protein
LSVTPCADRRLTDARARARAHVRKYTRAAEFACVLLDSGGGALSAVPVCVGWRETARHASETERRRAQIVRACVRACVGACVGASVRTSERESEGGSTTTMPMCVVRTREASGGATERERERRDKVSRALL